MLRGSYRKYTLKKFTDLGLAGSVLRAVSAEGYTHPTPIQTAVIPALIEGRDIIGIAQTGTGKTASFVLPLLHKISEKRDQTTSKTCHALILTPTRELASQIADNIRAYGQFTKHSAAVVVGGVKPGPQISALGKGLDILVATPGRLEDHLASGAVRLDKTTKIILDEADQMLDLGFMPAIRRIMAKLPKGRQAILMSATMPKQIRGLAQEFLRNPTEIAVTPVSKPIERINQTVLHVAKADKRRRLIEILDKKDVPRAIVFTRTKHGANKVVQQLEKAGLSAAAIHGNKSQSQRERALAGFRKGSIATLVATDIAARGIDVDGVSHVINFDLPNVPEVYVHRIGRTARAGNSGVAITLCDDSEFGLLRDVEKLIGHSFGITGAGKENAAGPRKQGKAGKSSVGPKNKSRSRHRGNNRNSAKSASKSKRGLATNIHGEASSAGLSRMLGNIRQSHIESAESAAA